MKSIYAKWWLIGLIGQISATSTLAQCLIPDECNPSKVPELKSTANRTGAMRQCLEKLVSVPPSGKKLYTYGHHGKIKAMRKMTKNEFESYNASIQMMREMRHIVTGSLSTFGQIATKIPDFKEAVISLAGTLNNKSYDLNDLKLECDQFLPPPPALPPPLPFPPAFAKASPTLDSREIREIYVLGCRLAALEKIYPGLLHFGFDPIDQAEMGGLIAQASVHKRLLKAGETQKLEGILLGLSVYKGIDTTAGRGVYLAERPSESLEHLSGEGDGLVCTLPLGTRELNIDFEDPVGKCNRDILEAAHVLVESKSKEFVHRPQSKNMIVSPGDFESVTKEMKLVMKFRPPSLFDFRPPYSVDKGAIDFQNDCAPITMSDFTDCGDFNQLLALDDVPKFLTQQAGFKDKFLEIVNNCTLTCSKPESRVTFDRFLGKLLLGGKVSEILLEDTSSLNTVLNNCKKITITERGIPFLDKYILRFTAPCGTESSVTFHTVKQLKEVVKPILRTVIEAGTI